MKHGLVIIRTGKGDHDVRFECTCEKAAWHLDENPEPFNGNEEIKCKMEKLGIPGGVRAY